ncbi:MAG: MotA/TolQ/ExbB proton channel family protein [Deltaproteobacteria bacterium]|nr:MotA/TolQ/ExbB proton channel family protein [Deltaproteobacteria bacterium]
MNGGPGSSSGTTVELDPLSLAKNSSGVVFVVLLLLILAAVAVWFILVLKLLQLRRWSRAQATFELDASRANGAEALLELARHHDDAPGARLLRALEPRRHLTAALEGLAKRALVDEQKRASSLLGVLGSIGSAGPFIGLFGTVWGIMDAFLRIGREKSASLPVVAPAIGEALIATAVGLFAAIPAVIGYNALSKRVDDLLDEVEAAAQGWVAILVTEGAAAAPAASPTPASSSLLGAPVGTPAPTGGYLPAGMTPRPGHTASTAPTPLPPHAAPFVAPRFPEPSESSGPFPLQRVNPPPGPPYQGG